MTLPRLNAVQVMGGIDTKKTIIIDAGHGGFDGGAVAADGTVEKNINLNIALLLGDMLSLNGFDVVYTRTDDVSTDDTESSEIKSRKKSDLLYRLNLMGDYPDSVFVSIHLNKFTASSANGAQVFYSPKIKSAQDLGQCVQSQIVSLLQPTNTRVVKQGTKSTYLLYNAKIPAVIVECGFLSNARELELLKTEEYQAKMAFSIFTGIINYYLEV